MVYTVTFNPSLDYVLNVSSFKLGQTNRSDSEYIYSGGKGVNVSRVLTNLGVENIALGFIAGFTGEEIEKEINMSGCKTDFIKLQSGLSRINIKLKLNEETEINAVGPVINDIALEKLFLKLDLIKDGDFLVLAGNVPNTLTENIYEDIIRRVIQKDIKIVVDTTGIQLINVLKYKPFLIKPNIQELNELFGEKVKNDNDIMYSAKMLQKQGAQNVLVSMGKQGAFMITYLGEIYKCEAPKGTLKNSVGSGDSMVAGFLASYINNNNIEDAFIMGVAAGSASAFSNKLATKDEIFNLLNMMQ